MAQSSIKNLEFRFLDKTYIISCPKENQVLLEMAAERLQETIETLSNRSTPFEKQAIMAALLMSFDIQKQQQEVDRALKELQEIRHSLLNLEFGEDAYDLISAQSHAMQL